MSNASDKTRDELTSITATYRDAKGTYEAHRDRWHGAITDAVDGGMKPAEVAKVVGVTPQRVQAIIVRVYSLPS